MSGSFSNQGADRSTAADLSSTFAVSISPTIYFCYADPTGFSGQKAATVLVMRGLERRGWSCRVLPQPVLDRTGTSRGLAIFKYFFDLLYSWGRAWRLLTDSRAILHVSLGQTLSGFLRDGVPILAARLVGRPYLVALNGSLFMKWANRSIPASIFQFLANRADAVVVVGELQRRRLLSWGITAGTAIVVPNTCDLVSLPESDFGSPSQWNGERPLRVLFLSSLIDTKGYPAFLEALQAIAVTPGPPIEAVLCGRIMVSEFAERFFRESEARAWIEGTIAAINRSGRVHIEWIDGATGEAKTALYRDADVFVLPTDYAVEAQPLVLLEAMASDCAIVTSRVGEIETILDSESALLLDKVSTPAVTDALQRLIRDPALLQRLASTARERFGRYYALERHLDQWEAIFRKVAKTNEHAS